jgi:hypothetical protein
MTEQAKQDIVDAVLYAMKQGCFFPVKNPRPPYSVKRLIKWGAMRNLHRAVAEACREAEA